VYEALHRTNDILGFMILIDGKKEAALLREQLKKEVSDLKVKYNINDNYILIIQSQ